MRDVVVLAPLSADPGDLIVVSGSTGEEIRQERDVQPRALQRVNALRQLRRGTFEDGYWLASAQQSLSTPQDGRLGPLDVDFYEGYVHVRRQVVIKRSHLNRETLNYLAPLDLGPVEQARVRGRTGQEMELSRAI
jgi:hypothetical protein